MKKTMVLAALSTALSITSFSASALTTSYTVGDYFSSEAGAVTETFAGGLPINYSGGGIFSTTTGEYAKPVGSTDNYWSIGTSGGQDGPGVLTFAAPVSYFGFLWGSPDKYNTVTFYNGITELGSFDGSAVLQPPNGDQNFSAYFNAYATDGLYITSVKFTSTGNAFETDNHAVITAVPEPETYAMMLAGLGLMGFVARRRKS